MKLDTIYESINERLGRIDFSKLWKGFHRFRFALYTDSECVFDGKHIEKPKEFLANTAVEYNGELVAIWNLMEEPDDLDAMTASMVHEMFHAFQRESGESRWPDENAALKQYEYSAENVSRKLKEAELLRKMLLSGEGAGFKELAGLLKKRSLLFPYEYRYEAETSQIEGSACFVELRALEQLAPQKAKVKMNKLLDEITDPARYAPVRVIQYSVGAALLECVSRFTGFDYCEFTEVPFAVKLVEKAEPSESVIPVDPAAEKTVREFIEGTEAIVRNAVEKNEVLLSGKYPLVSLNIYNARRHGPYAVSTFFIAYMDGGEQRVIFENVVAELDEDNNILKIYRQ